MRKWLTPSLTILVFSTLAISVSADDGKRVSVQTTQSSGSAFEGRRAFLKYNCSGCHGARGGGGMAPNIVGEADEVGEAVLQGKDEGMPSYQGIVTTTDINNLAAYLRSIGKPGEPTFNDWWVASPTK